jgi:hypothetical protein
VSREKSSALKVLKVFLAGVCNQNEGKQEWNENTNQRPSEYGFHGVHHMGRSVAETRSVWAATSSLSAEKDRKVRIEQKRSPVFVLISIDLRALQAHLECWYFL